MFRKNVRHLQIPLTSHVDELPRSLRERLQNSWAETFYREFFCRLDEQAFAVLYADQPSRPNVPVNVLVGLEFLKAANGWSDEEMYNEFCYNVQVRYALGYRHLGEGYFDLRTLYYFRERLARHMQETGENLLEQAFEQVTDEQLRAFSLKTGQQRMDSTLLRVNHGWRTARTPGFVVDFESGDVAEPQAQTVAVPVRRPQRPETVRLAVQDTQNLLLLRPSQPGLFDNRAFALTLQYALQRGMEQVYQLEENELAAEQIGRDVYAALLFYETSEGGSGVLRCLLEDSNALAEVAHAALERLHYDPLGADQKPDCVAACYECLLSYSNQLDAFHLDRRVILPFLLELARSRTLARVAGRPYAEHLAVLRSLTDARSDLERRFLAALAAGGHRLPDDAQHAISDPRCVADFFYAPNILVFCDGIMHDEPAQRR